MSVIVVSSPDAYALTKGGRMLYRFSGSGRTQTTGVKAVNSIGFKIAVPDGTTITLRWNGKTRTITARTSPGRPDEFPTGDGSVAYVDSLATYFSKYFPFREDFIVSRHNLGDFKFVDLTARQPGEVYNIGGTGSIYWAAGRSVDGADALIRAQYSIYVEVWLQKAGTPGTNPQTDFERVFRAPVETDAAGKAEFDAGPILHDYLSPDWPSWNVAQPALGVNSTRKYYLAVAEAYGSPLEIGQVESLAIKTACLGGADYINRANGGYSLSGFVGVTPVEDSALRFGPRTRYVRPDEPQFLTFLNTRATQTGSLLQIKLIWSEDTGDNFQYKNDLLTAITVPSGGKVTYPVGPLQLNLAASMPAGKQLREYTVQRISAQLEPLSVVYRYLVDYDHQEHVRYLVFVSSLGAPEAISTYGLGSRELTVLSEQAEKFLPSNYEVSDGQFVDYNVATQQQVDVATGFWPKAQLEAFTDFYRSPNKFHLKSGLALPIGLTGKSIKQYKDDDTRFAHQFAFAYLNQNDFYTGLTGADAAGDGEPPVYFTPAGSVNLTLAQVINTTDPSVGNWIRNLTQEQINLLLALLGQPNAQTLGFLDQAAGNLLYRLKSQKIDYADLINVTPVTLDSLFGSQEAHTSLNLEANANLVTRQRLTEPRAKRGHSHQVQQPDGSFKTVSFAGDAGDGSHEWDIEDLRAMMLSKLQLVLGVPRLDGPATKGYFNQVGLANPLAGVATDNVAYTRWNPAELKHEFAIRSMQQLADDLKPYLNVSTTPTQSQPFVVDILYCYDVPDEIPTSPRKFIITPAMVGVPQTHGLNTPGAQLAYLFKDANGDDDQVMLLGFPDANHFTVSYPDSTVSGYPGGTLILL